MPDGYYASILDPIAAIATPLMIKKEDVRNALRKLERKAKAEMRANQSNQAMATNLVALSPRQDDCRVVQ